MSRRRKHGRAISGILLLDKPTGITSNHALQRVKKLFNARKAGHTGSLDPLATGVLPICFGEATKVCSYLLSADKRYLVGARLGRTTNTGDADGETLQESEVAEDLDIEKLQQASRRFTGVIKQLPPMYSAVKIDGQRLYKLAREGKTVERDTREVTVFSIDVLHLEDTLAVMSVHCSKGTYIRTLVEDIGQALGCGAHVESLRRTEVAPFYNAPIWTITALEALQSDSYSALDNELLPTDTALVQMRAAQLTAAMAGLFGHGQAVPLPAGLAPSGSKEPYLRVYGPDGLLGIGEIVAEDRLRPQRILNTR